MLDFWATWCEGCKEEIPWFMEFQDKYNKTGLTVVGASLDDDGWKSVKPYLREYKINYRSWLERLHPQSNSASAKACR